MGWSLGYDSRRERYIGYGVPAYCDHPDCTEEIDRGLAYLCGDLEAEQGCGLYFCEVHRGGWGLCGRCRADAVPFEPRPDHPGWIRHVMTHPSWAEWRALKGLTSESPWPERITRAE